MRELLNKLENLGKNEEALKCCDKLVEILPNDFYIYLNKVELLKKLGRYEEAIEFCNRFIEYMINK